MWLRGCLIDRGVHKSNISGWKEPRANSWTGPSDHEPDCECIARPEARHGPDDGEWEERSQSLNTGEPPARLKRSFN